MIRVYCDSNIYRYLNPKHPSYSSELKDVFDSLKGKMLFTFSDAHLDDLKDSQPEFAEADLLRMGEYVDDNYFMHDFVNEKRTGPYLATPLKAFKGKNYNAYDKVFENPFDIDKLFEEFSEDDFTESLKGMLKSFYNLPVGIWGSGFNATITDPNSKQLFDKFSPNYNSEMTLGEFINDIWPFTKMLFKDKRTVAELRRSIAGYMKPDEYSFEKWGIAFNSKFKDSPVGKTFLEVIESMLTDSQKDDLYQKFNYAYTMLEIYNITQERTSSGPKKFTLASLNTDALHAWYASFSDYLITNDKGMQVKASIVYNLLGLPTKVLSLQDFINHKTIWLGREETWEQFTQAFSYDLKHSFQLYHRQSLLQDQTVTNYKPNHYYFNYFNRYQTIQSDDSTMCAFYCDRESHANFFLYREIELLVNKLINMLGTDDQNRGRFSMEEKARYEDGDSIRQWKKGDINFALRTSSMSWGTLLCLCLTFPKT
jgi:hypothetical protein